MSDAHSSGAVFVFVCLSFKKLSIISIKWISMGIFQIIKWMILASADQSAHITSDTSMRFFLNTEAKIILIRNEIEWLGRHFLT